MKDLLQAKHRITKRELWWKEIPNNTKIKLRILNLHSATTKEVKKAIYYQFVAINLEDHNRLKLTQEQDIVLSLPKIITDKAINNAATYEDIDYEVTTHTIVELVLYKKNQFVMEFSDLALFEPDSLHDFD